MVKSRDEMYRFYELFFCFVFLFSTWDNDQTFLSGSMINWSMDHVWQTQDRLQTLRIYECRMEANNRKIGKRASTSHIVTECGHL